jgi:hypothetical protein
MNSGRNISFAFVLMLFLQVVICQVFQFGSYCVISLLPAMLICLPTSMSTLKCMLSAFFIALFVDFFGDGLLGLNAFSLLPLAYARNFIFTKLFNEELITRGEPLSWRKWGVGLVFGAAFLFEALFLVIYITVDAAGVRDFVPCLQTFLISLPVNLLLGMGVLYAFLEK